MALPYPPVPTWRDEFDLLAIQDAVLGGLDGPANKTAKQLADAVVHLKKLIDGAGAAPDVILVRNTSTQRITANAYQVVEQNVIARDDTNSLQGGGSYGEITVPPRYSYARVSAGLKLDTTNTSSYVMGLAVSVNGIFEHSFPTSASSSNSNMVVYPQTSVISPIMPVFEGDVLAAQLYQNRTLSTLPGQAWMQIEFYKSR
jgi:hypothetical protein